MPTQAPAHSQIRKVVFVESLDSEQKWEQMANKSDVALVASNERIYENLKIKSQGEVRRLQEFDSAQDIQEIENVAWKIAREWWKQPSVASFLTRANINAGSMVELYVGLYLVWLLKHMHAVFRYTSIYTSASFIVATGIHLNKQPTYFPKDNESIIPNILDWLKIPHTILDPSPKQIPIRRSSVVKQLVRKGALFFYTWLVRPFACVRSKKKCLVICSAPHHVRELLPYLRVDHDLVYWDEEFRLSKLPYLVQNGIPYFSYPELKRDAGADKLLVSVPQETKASFFKAVENSRQFVYREMEFSSLAWDRLGLVLEHAAQQIPQYQDTFLRHISKQKLSGIIVDEDTVTFRKTLVTTGNACGVTTILIPHGVNLQTNQYDLLPLTSQYALVGGEGIKNFYVSKQIDASRLVITGIPRYKIYLENKPADIRQKIKQKLNMDEKEKIIFFASSFVYENMEVGRTVQHLNQAMNDFFECLKDYDGYKLVIRLHPLDFEGFWTKKFLKQHPHLKNIHWAKDWPTTSELVMASDLVVSVLSNVMVESLFCGTPTLLLDYHPSDALEASFMNGEGRLIRAHDLIQMRKLLQRFWNSDDQMKSFYTKAKDWYRSYWLSACRVDSSKQMAEHISRLLV